MPPVSLVLVALVATAAAFVAADCPQTALANIQPTAEVLGNLTDARNATTVVLNVPPRYMWGWGPGYHGYCGSFSTQSIALYYGLWVSAEFVRYAANTSEVLLGFGHYTKVAKVFGLEIDIFDNAGLSPTISRYLDWVVAHTRAGHPVIGGVFERKEGGDSDYDHIVPLVGGTELAAANMLLPVDPVTGRRSNVTGIVFNDLYSPRHRQMRGSVLAVNRSDWTTPTWTQPYDYALPFMNNYGVAILGLSDPNAETFRLKLSAWSWTEPDWGAEDRCQEQNASNPKPGPMDLSATVFGLTAGTAYTILRFDGNTTASDVSSDFLKSRQWSRRWDFVASSDTYVVDLFDRIMTNTVVTYRAVANSDQQVIDDNERRLRKAWTAFFIVLGMLVLALIMITVGVLIRWKRESNRQNYIAENQPLTHSGAKQID